MLTYIATDPGREDEARAAMIEELEKVWRDPPTDEELTRARNYSAGEVQLRQQRARAVAAELLEAWIYGELATAAREADDLRAVSRDQVCEVAREVFRPDARAEYVVRGR